MQSSQGWNWVFVLWITSALGFAGAAPAAVEEFEAAKEVQQDIDASAEQTQDRINELSQAAQDMLAKFRAARDEAASLAIYNDHLATLVASQDAEIASFEDQLAAIGETQQAFVPFMQRAIATLDEFVERDLPFLLEERAQRVRELKGLLQRADITTAEKFRTIMEAYQTELEYGRTIGAYRGQLTLPKGEHNVRFLRIGRVALLFQTLDRRTTGRWDPNTDSWQVLDGSWRRAVENGLAIATEQSAPGLLRVPVSAPGGQS